MKLRKWESSNLKLQSAKVKIFKNLQTWVFKLESEKLQTWNLKLRKWKSSKLRAESFQLLSFDKLQVLILRIRTACSKLSYQSWMLKVVECLKLLNLQSWILNVESCWRLKVIKVESWKLLNLESWKLLNVESVEYWKFANCKNLLSTNKFSKAFILYTIWY